MSGPVVAERVGIAFFDVVKGRGLLPISAVDGIDEKDTWDSDSGLETTVLKKMSVSVSVFAVTSACLLNTILLSSSANRKTKVLVKLPGLSDANVAVDTTVTKTIGQFEGAAVAIDAGASVLA